MSRFWKWIGRFGSTGRITPPKVILLIRHGEKSGKKSDIHLNERGRERANALLKLFPARFHAPDFIFATKATEFSNRPIETVTPLAQKFGLSIDGRFANWEFGSLARELMSSERYSGRTVLVCWHRGKIPALAAALGATAVEAEWEEERFDRIWKIEFGAEGAVVADLPQRLLPGDSAG